MESVEGHSQRTTDSSHPSKLTLAKSTVIPSTLPAVWHRKKSVGKSGLVRLRPIQRSVVEKKPVVKKAEPLSAIEEAAEIGSHGLRLKYLPKLKPQISPTSGIHAISGLGDTNETGVKESGGKINDRSTEECIQNFRQQRVVRLFISSTFKDFKDERSAFNTHLFPRLSQFCADRGYIFLPVELRWGIAFPEGKVFETCIRDVLLSRPYFLCLMGERYGWCQATAPSVEQLMEDIGNAEHMYPWIKEFEDRSVTELEIRAATLNNAACTDTSRAWFFFRDQTLSAKIDIDLNEQARQKQRNLKDEIRHAGFRVHESYTSSEEVVEAAYKEIVQVLGEDLGPPLAPVKPCMPKASLEMLNSSDIAGALEGVAYRPSAGEPRDFQFGFIKSCTVGYARQDLEDRLMHYLHSDERRILCVSGGGGCGKTSLLANIVLRLFQEDSSISKPLTNQSTRNNRDRSVSKQPLTNLSKRNNSEFPHTRSSPPWKDTKSKQKGGVEWRVLCAFLGAHNMTDVLPLVIPQDKSFFGKAMQETTVDDLFQRGLVEFARQIKARVLCVFDALDKLSGKMPNGFRNPQELHWLPTDLPPNLKIIVSVPPGKTLDTLVSMGSRVEPVPAMGLALKRKVVVNYLSLFQKELKPELLDALCSYPVTDNFLCLRVILEELRTHGDHDTGFRTAEVFKARFQGFLAASSLHELLNHVIELWETDFGVAMVRQVLTLLAISFRGVTQSELATLASFDEETAWGAFLGSAANYATVNEFGRLALSRGGMTGAVQMRYLCDSEFVANTRLCLIEFLEKAPLERGVTEVAHQLKELPDAERLREYLVQSDVFVAFSVVAPNDLMQYKEIVSENIQTICSAIVIYMKESAGHFSDACAAGQFICSIGRFVEAAELYQKAESVFDRVPSAARSDLAGWVRVGVKAYEGTLDSYQTLKMRLFLIDLLEEKSNETVAAEPERVELLMELGDLYSKTKSPDQAAVVLKRALELQRAEIGRRYHPVIANILRRLGSVYAAMKKYDEASSMFQQALNMYEGLGVDELQLGTLLMEFGELLYFSHEYEEASAKLKRSAELIEKIYGDTHPLLADVLMKLSRAQVFLSEGYLYMTTFEQKDEAIRSALRAVAICERSSDAQPLRLANALTCLGIVYRETGQYENAIVTHNRALAIRQRLAGIEHKEASTLNQYMLMMDSAIIFSESLRDNYLEDLMSLGKSYQCLGQYEAAIPVFQHLVAHTERIYFPGHPRRDEPYYCLASLYADMGRNDEGIKVILGALQYMGGRWPEVKSDALSLLTRMRDKTGDY